jgi:hypothetical protein
VSAVDVYTKRFICVILLANCPIKFVRPLCANSSTYFFDASEVRGNIFIHSTNILTADAIIPAMLSFGAVSVTNYITFSVCDL